MHCLFNEGLVISPSPTALTLITPTSHINRLTLQMTGGVSLFTSQFISAGARQHAWITQTPAGITVNKYTLAGGLRVYQAHVKYNK